MLPRVKAIYRYNCTIIGLTKCIRSNKLRQNKSDTPLQYPFSRLGGGICQTGTLFFFFFPSHLLSSPFCSLSLLVVTQIRGHIAGSFPPLPTTVRALHFYRESISALCSLVDSCRIVLTHARRSQQLILFCFFFAIKFKISPRRDSNSRNTINSSIRGLP